MGDLISREALQHVYDESCVGLCEVCKYYKVYDESTPDECVFGCKLIDDAPAVDAVEVVHGRWIDSGDFEQCSECKATRLKEFRSHYGKTTWLKTPYCPSCGAKMDGGKKNDAGQAF